MSKEIDNALLEILRMAREIVINEYTDMRAEIHNKWLVESDKAWKVFKVRLPYPTIPPHPTEIDIVRRAQVLFDFIVKDKRLEIHPAEVDPTLPNNEPEPEKIAEQPQEQVVNNSPTMNQTTESLTKEELPPSPTTEESPQSSAFFPKLFNWKK